MPEREFDVVVFGATSVTGRRVAAYLAERTADTDLSWAAAARDLAKLDRVLGDERVQAPAVIAADIGDPQALREMASRARVVINLVGPYTRFGEPVIQACVAAGAHYVDLTGEVPFVRRMIDAHDEAARAAEVKIVQVCGFEALPPDLGVALARATAAERFGESLATVDLELAVTAMPPGMPRPSTCSRAARSRAWPRSPATPMPLAWPTPRCLSTTRSPPRPCANTARSGSCHDAVCAARCLRR